MTLIDKDKLLEEMFDTCIYCDYRDDDKCRAGQECEACEETEFSRYEKLINAQPEINAIPYEPSNRTPEVQEFLNHVERTLKGNAPMPLESRNLTCNERKDD